MPSTECPSPTNAADTGERPGAKEAADPIATVPVPGPGLRFVAMSSDLAADLRAGSTDAYGLVPERGISPGGYPCRHCFRDIAVGEACLTLAYRPFPTLQPYAETGPIFLHAEACPPYQGAAYHGAAALLPMLTSPDYILRGYDADNGIVYGTGSVTPTADIIDRAGRLLADPAIAYVHVRSARNNCYHCRIERA